jgi:hypothetical protein
MKAEKGAGGVISACMKNGGAQAQFALALHILSLSSLGWTDAGRGAGRRINRPTETLAILSDQPKIRLMVGGRNAGRQRQSSPCMARVRCHLAWLNVTMLLLRFTAKSKIILSRSIQLRTKKMFLHSIASEHSRIQITQTYYLRKSHTVSVNGIFKTQGWYSFRFVLVVAE